LTPPGKYYLPGGVNVHPPSSTPQLASTPYQCCPMLSWLLDMSWAGHFSRSTLLLHTWWSGRLSNTWFLVPTRVHFANGISISSAIFAQLRAYVLYNRLPIFPQNFVSDIAIFLLKRNIKLQLTN